MGKPAIFVDIDCLRRGYGSVDADFFTAMDRLDVLRRDRFGGTFSELRLCSVRGRNFADSLADQLGVTGWNVIAGGSYFFNFATGEIRQHPVINKKIRKQFRGILRWKVPRILRRYPCLEYCPEEDVCLVLEKKQTGLPLSIEEMLSGIKKTFLRDLRKNRIAHVTHSKSAIFVVPLVISFFSAVKFMAEFDDIDLKRSLAIGASKADISLFRCVGRTGCPSNALPECWEAVTQRRGKLSQKPCASGVVDIIEWYMGLQN